MVESDLKKFLADILYVLALTMSAEGESEILKYILLGSEGDIGSWGHEYVSCKESIKLDERYEHQRNEDMFVKEINPLVSKAFVGKKLTIITFGARGSGKTYTIQGFEENPGLVVRAGIGSFLIGRTLAVLITMTLGTSMAVRQGPVSMAAHHIFLQVWLAVSLLTDALASSAQLGLLTGALLAVILGLSFSALATLFTKDMEVLSVVKTVVWMAVGAISSAYLLCAPSIFGFRGVWSGLTLFMGLRAVAGCVRLVPRIDSVMIKFRRVILEKPWFVGLLLAGLIGGVLLLSVFLRIGPIISCRLTGLEYLGFGTQIQSKLQPSSSLIQLKEALLHYATSPVVPQQSYSEISISFAILQQRAPCNFLVFGLGHDSLMWSAFNPQGTTLFLEEDPKWFHTVLQRAPHLRAHTVRYRTKMSEADELFSWYRSEPDCSTIKSQLRGNDKCKLALTGLPDEFYNTEWDLIMIDAPRGYYPEAPGRMGAIYSAAVMARNRKGLGPTHVFLHDVDRKVEKMYAQEFLCTKYLVNGTGRLWHFQIPPASNATAIAPWTFC